MSTSTSPRTLLCLLLPLALGPAACGSDSTTGHAVVLHTRLTTDLPADSTVLSGLGWTVTLSKAVVSSGALYYFDGEPAFTMARPRGGWRRMLAGLSPIGTAWAHPGHYIAGSARGQMLLPFTENLMAGPVDLPDGSGITGPIRSGTFSFAAPATGPVIDLLGGHVVSVEGTATKSVQTINFAFTADLADVSKNAKDAAITGCTFTEIELEKNGTVTVTVKPKIWFDLVDFSELAPGTAATPTVADPSTTAYVAFSLGLVQLSAYQFAYAPEVSP